MVVIPGIAAFALNAPLDKADEAYPWLLSNILPTGIKGIVFAALASAIVAALASLMNSISTIFTMDIYRPFFRKKAAHSELITVGRLTSIFALLIAVFIAPMLTDLDQAFQYIQEFTGFISPGILAIFLSGFFYKRATSNGALVAALSSVVFSFAFKLIWPEYPWMDRMTIVFLLSALIIFIMRSPKGELNSYITINAKLLKTSKTFNILSILVLVILIAIYYMWW